MASRPARIVLIGAGSASFGLGTLRDLVQTPEIKGGTLALIDLNEQAVQIMARMAGKMSQEAGAELRIVATTDRCETLPEADFVIVSIERDRERLWKLDFEVPLKHGIKQVYGENGGPGGMFHSLRNIPPLLAIAHDMERLCPNALLINFSNPMSRLCLALARHATIRSVGLCHGIHNHMHRISRITGVEFPDLEPRAAGINHFTWILDLRRRSTGEDVYPILRQACKSYDPTYLPLDRYLFDKYGLFPSPSDDHPGEYLSFAWEIIGTPGADWDAMSKHRDDQWALIERYLSGAENPDWLTTRRSGERAADIIAAVVSGRNSYELAVNIPNQGHIANLPEGCIVEVPAVVSSWGVKGLNVGPLPEGIAALLRPQLGVQELVVEAAVTGDRKTALQALLADPVVNSARAAEATLDELLRLQADFLPEFA